MKKNIAGTLIIDFIIQGMDRKEFLKKLAALGSFKISGYGGKEADTYSPEIMDVRYEEVYEIDSEKDTIKKII